MSRDTKIGVLCFLAFVVTYALLMAGPVFLSRYHSDISTQLPLLAITGIMALLASLALVSVTLPGESVGPEPGPGPARRLCSRRHRPQFDCPLCHHVHLLPQLAWVSRSAKNRMADRGASDGFQEQAAER